MKELHRAPLVVPVATPVLENGAVLTENGRIVVVGAYADLRGEGVLVDHEGAVLTPPLINGHVHLELSHLAGLGKSGSWQGDITSWIRKLLAARENAQDDLFKARQVLDEFYNEGVALVADTGNLTQSREIGRDAQTEVIFFLEMLGLSRSSAQNSRERLTELDDFICTGHAPYSTGADLLSALHDRAKKRNEIFSIHVAESEAETQFLRDASGPFRDFVEERGVWDDSFEPPGCGSVTYLDRLALLDEQTFCVHCVHVSDDEIRLLAQRRAKVCLCPASNRFIGVGKAPVEKMVEAGLLPALGTDSLASNSKLSMWNEIKVLRQDHPSLDPALVFAMATLGGAQALGSGDFGQLVPGSSAQFLAVTTENVDSKNVYDFLTTGCEAKSVSWVSGGQLQ